MVSIVVRVSAASMALSTLTAANAGDREWYVSIEAGATFGGDYETLGVLSSPLCGMLGIGPGCAPSGSVEAGWAALGAVGAYVMPNLRLEAEVGQRSQSLSGYSGLTNLTQTTLMANALFDIPMSERFTLSIGGGLGIDWVDTGAGDVGMYSGSDTALAYQLIAGLSYDLADNIDLTLNYRYTDSQIDNLHAVVDGAPPGFLWDVVAVDGIAATSTISAGLRFEL